MISAILLGAGESKRMGFDKLSLPWGKRTVFEQCFETLLHSRVGEVVIVRSLQSLQSKGVMNLSGGKKIKMITNPRPAKGMSTSIRKGLGAIRPGSDGILIALGDQPFLKARTINSLIHAFEQGKGRIIVPSFRGRTGHPVIFHRAYKQELMNLKGDVGGRSVVERHREDVWVVRVKSIGVVKDMDTWQDYEESRKREGAKRKRAKKGFGKDDTPDE